VLGIAPFREALDEKLTLARWLADELAATPPFELVTEPELSLFAFRLHPPGVEGEALDALNRELLARVNARNPILDCGYVLRACVLSFRTHRDRVEAGLADLRAEAAALLAR